MSIEHVKGFYQRLAKDETFKAQIQGSESKSECSQIVREAGYDFTQEEFEEFTAQLLDSSAELDETELEAAVGGIDTLLPNKKIMPVPLYGLPPSPVM
ncbi:MAG: Nif11-like leader peptide family natural product precursor [Xenococcaceae cyanobacterium MO_167.B27]|nr:Nif11-like leader peptide family natural product precursor [Xenococcaceae cyanobacterium MO_167.B27]